MPVFRTRSDGSQMIMQPFFNVLTDFLYTLVKSGKLDMMNLAPDLHAKSDVDTYSSNSNKWATDVLLMRSGIPLAAVRIEVHSSGAANDVDGYVTAPAYAGIGAPTPSINDVGKDLAERMRMEMPEVPEKPQPIKELMSEMTWVVIIRAQGTEPKKWEGGPFDISRVEEAFDALVTMLVTATKPVAP